MFVQLYNYRIYYIISFRLNLEYIYAEVFSNRTRNVVKMEKALERY